MDLMRTEQQTRSLKSGDLTGNLRKYRRRMRMTQQDVADRLGLQRSTYSRYEEGTNRPSYKILIELADLYQITMDELLGRIPDWGDETGENGKRRSYDTEERIRAAKVADLFLNASSHTRETVLLILENSELLGKAQKNSDSEH